MSQAVVRQSWPSGDWPLQWQRSPVPMMRQLIDNSHDQPYVFALIEE